MGDLHMTIDRAKLKQLALGSDGTAAIVASVTSKVAANANSMGAAYRTGYYHRDHKSPAVGGTQPSYAGDVRKYGYKPVGIVHPKNYAAMKDNMLHNTLLKSL